MVMMNNIKTVWSDEDQEYVSTTDKYPSLSYLDECPEKSRKGLEEIIEHVENDLKIGESISYALLYGIIVFSGIITFGSIFWLFFEFLTQR